MLYDTAYMWNLENNINESICKTETFRDIENKLMATNEEREGEKRQQIKRMALLDIQYYA